MKLFSRRKPADNTLPPEIQAYAVAEQRERRGMAWIVGIMSLLVTLLVLAVLFLGGRWVYRKINPQDTPSVKTSQDQAKEQQKPADNKPQAGSGVTDTPDSGASSTDQPVQAPVSSQPSTGDNGAETLVRTGPDVDL